MLINCNTITDKLSDYRNKVELYSITGDRVCQYYTDVLFMGTAVFIEIPICAIDINYFLADRKQKKAITFSTRDRSIRNMILITEDDELKKRKAGNFYIRAKNLYRMI